MINKKVQHQQGNWLSLIRRPSSFPPPNHFGFSLIEHQLYHLGMMNDGGLQDRTHHSIVLSACKE